MTSDENATRDINFKDLISFYEDKICDITFVISRYPMSNIFYSTILLDEKYLDVINFYNKDLRNTHFLDNEKLPKIIAVTPWYGTHSTGLTFEYPNFKRIKSESINVINEILKTKEMNTMENEDFGMGGFTEDFYNHIRRIREIGPDFTNPEMERLYYENGRRYIKISDNSVLGVKLESYLIRYKDYYFTIFHLDERHRKDGLFGYYFVALVATNNSISEEKLLELFGNEYYGIYRKENDEKLHKEYKYHIIKTDFEWNRDDAENWFKNKIDKLK